MEFREVVRRRKMVRAYTDQPVSPDLVNRLVEAGRRAPTAGFTQGVAFVVLEDEGTETFWTHTLRDQPGRWARLRSAPALIVVATSDQAYRDRYREPDKANADFDPDWPVMDASFAVMSMLLAATDAGLGALFFSVPNGREAVADALGIPTEYRIVGAVTLGWPDPSDRPSRSLERGRRPRGAVVHRGHWRT